MRKSNFFKSLFLSQGLAPCTSKRKRIVTFNIITFLLIGMFSGNLVANAEEAEVSPSSPDTAILAELTALNCHMDNLEMLIEEDISELQNVNANIQVLNGVAGHIFGGIFLILIIIVFIAVYKLFSIFFRY